MSAANQGTTHAQTHLPAPHHGVSSAAVFAVNQGTTPPRVAPTVLAGVRSIAASGAQHSPMSHAPARCGGARDSNATALQCVPATRAPAPRCPESRGVDGACESKSPRARERKSRPKRARSGPNSTDRLEHRAKWLSTEEICEQARVPVTPVYSICQPHDPSGAKEPLDETATRKTFAAINRYVCTHLAPRCLACCAAAHVPSPTPWGVRSFEQGMGRVRELPAAAAAGADAAGRAHGAAAKSRRLP